MNESLGTDRPAENRSRPAYTAPSEFEQAPIPKGDNLMRDTTIKQLNHGYIVTVGCQTFAISSSSDLISLLAEYILNPQDTERTYFEGKLFK